LKIGVLICWCAGVLVCWYADVLVCWYADVLVMDDLKICPSTGSGARLLILRFEDLKI
jgi:hypothetical protein